MAGIHIVVDDAEVIAALGRMRQTTSNMRPFFLELGEELTESTKARFGTEADPTGAPWQPLSAGYLASKRKRKSRGPNRILTLMGPLGSTIHYQASTNSVVIGSNLEYAATQQFGRGATPARPFLGLSAQDRTTIISTALDYFEKAIPG